MRGATLLKLLTDLRIACGLSTNPAHNSQARDSQVAHLQAAQEWLWEDTQWPHLRVYRDIRLQAGERYYAPPNDILIDHIERIDFRYGNQWVPLTAGISDVQYRAFDSDLDVRSWPVERWQIFESEQIEVWPIPANDYDSLTLDGTLRVYGYRSLKPLVDDDDRADLDSRLIVGYAAAEHLVSKDKALSQLKLTQVSRLYANLKAGMTPRRRVRMFVGHEDDRGLRGPPRVHYRYSGAGTETILDPGVITTEGGEALES